MNKIGGNLMKRQGLKYHKRLEALESIAHGIRQIYKIGDNMQRKFDYLYKDEYKEKTKLK